MLVSNHHKHPQTMFDCLIFNLIRTGYVMFDYPKAARRESASSQSVSSQQAVFDSVSIVSNIPDLKQHGGFLKWDRKIIQNIP